MVKVFGAKFPSKFLPFTRQTIIVKILVSTPPKMLVADITQTFQQTLVMEYSHHNFPLQPDKFWHLSFNSTSRV